MKLTKEMMKQAESITDQFEPQALLDLLTKKYGLVKVNCQMNTREFNLLTTSDNYTKTTTATKSILSFNGKIYQPNANDIDLCNNQLPIAS